MDDIQHINDQLRDYPEKIYKASQRTEELREQWLLTEARRDLEKSKAFLMALSFNNTAGQAKAKSEESVYETTQSVIIAESAYRRALADQTRVENEFTAIRKMANLLETTIQNTGRL